MTFCAATRYYSETKYPNILAFKFEHFSIALCKALCLKEVHIPLNGYNHSPLLMTVGFLYFIVRQNIYNRSLRLQRITEYR